jgi:hypothetical protein
MKSVQYLESLLTEPIDLNAYNSIIELDASSIQQFSKNYNSLFSDTELKNFLSVEVSKAGSPADPEIPLVIASNYNQEPASLGKAAPNVMQSNEGRKNIDSGKFPRQCKGTRYQLKQLKPVEPLVTQYKKSNRSNMTNQPQKPIAGSMSSGFTSPKATKKTSEGLKTFADALSRKRNEIGSKRLAEARSPEKEGQKLSKNEISRPAITCVKQMISASKVRQSEQDQTKSETINKDAKAGTSPEHLLRHRGTLDDHSHRMVLGVAHRLSPEKNLSKLENSVLSKIRGILSSGEVVSAPNCCSDVQRDKVIDSRTEAMPRFEPLPSQGTQSYSEKSLQNVTETSKNESSESSGLIGLGNYQKRTCSPIKGSRKTRPDSPQKLLENRDSSLMLRGRFSKGNESAGTAPPQKKSIEGSLDELSNLESRKSVRLCQMSLKEYSSSGMTSSIVTKNGQERRDFSALRRHLEEVSNTGAQGGYFIAKSTPKPIQNIGYHNLLSLGGCKPVNRF